MRNSLLIFLSSKQQLPLPLDSSIFTHVNTVAGAALSISPCQQLSAVESFALRLSVISLPPGFRHMLQQKGQPLNPGSHPTYSHVLPSSSLECKSQFLFIQIH